MLTYLTEGWFNSAQPQALRAEILDGAVDSAGLLTRAGVGPDTLLTLRQLLMRHCPYRAGAEGDAGSPNQRERLQALIEHVTEATDHNLILQGFVMDCLQSAAEPEAWQALCDHLRHISLAMQTLDHMRTRRREQADHAPGTVALDQGRGQGPITSALRS